MNGKSETKIYGQNAEMIIFDDHVVDHIDEKNMKQIRDELFRQIDKTYSRSFSIYREGKVFHRGQIMGTIRNVTA